MTKDRLSDDAVEALLFASLEDEELAVPGPVQSALIRELRRRRDRWRLPWWLPAAIGALQTAAMVGAVWLLLPGSLFAFIALAAGAGIFICACILSELARRSWKEDEAGC